MPVLARRAPILALLITLVLATPSAGWAKLTQEYDLKAAFLFHFAQFVDWPHARGVPLGDR